MPGKPTQQAGRLRTAMSIVMVNLFPGTVRPEMNPLENQLLYRPYSELAYLPSAVDLRYQEVHLSTADGVQIHGWFMPADGTSAEASLRPDKRRTFHGYALLYCHGNGGNISHRLDRARLYNRLGFSQFMFDYRGYGKSQGVPSEAGTYEDAEAAWNYLTESLKIPRDRIVLYGESLGCAIALEMALRHPPKALVLESPFTSTVEMARRLFPSLPVDSIIQNRYDNLAKIPKLQAPLLIMHSPSDYTVPYTMGRALFDAAPKPKTFFNLRGTHAMAYHDSGPAYANALQDFLQSAL